MLISELEGIIKAFDLWHVVWCVEISWISLQTTLARVLPRLE